MYTLRLDTEDKACKGESGSFHLEEYGILPVGWLATYPNHPSLAYGRVVYVL